MNKQIGPDLKRYREFKKAIETAETAARRHGDNHLGDLLKAYAQGKHHESFGQDSDELREAAEEIRSCAEELHAHFERCATFWDEMANRKAS